MELLASTEKYPARIQVWKMFDRIAARYDMLNRILSLGQDIIWRKKVAQVLPQTPQQNILDLATGTGDQLIYLYKCSDRISHGTGIDLASEMLAVGEKKINQLQLNDVISLEKGDAENIQFESDSFDVVTMSFGIRNVTDVKKSLGEMLRVLKKKGRVIILEFSLPKYVIVKKLYLFYFRHILPFIGGVISGDKSAYQYLNKTVETFPYGKQFCDLMTGQGFKDVQMKVLTFGIATIYYGDK
jgi:demethylmenaquinone methyltransferase/2-methoxy-6-polyprenyl-1,4-benzoquinol methylase